jgi:hypothetical protein
LHFFLMMVGLLMVLLGAIAFFIAFYYPRPTELYLAITSRQGQTWAMGIAAAGVLMYVVAALALGVPLSKTTYYAISTILRNEPFDPPRHGDYTQALLARIQDLGDEWALMTEVSPPDSEEVIPQVLIGPGGVFALHTLNENPSSILFKDPGAGLASAAKKLGEKIGQPVTAMIVLPIPKMVTDYKKKFTPRTRLADLYSVAKNLEKSRQKLDEDQRRKVEEQVFALIKGTPPGA